MKIKNGLILAAMLSTTLAAQTVTNTTSPTLLPQPPISTTPAAAPAAVPPPALDAAPTPADTNQPAAKPVKSAKKKKNAATTAKKKAKPAAGANLEITVAPNEPAVAKQDHVNVRAQAHINSEVVTHLKRGDTVTVLDIVTIKPKTDEPAKWAKIALPADTHAWVNTSFLDTNKTVVPTKLNVRSGPGENFSVMGTLHKGDAVKDLSTKGEWTEIEAPTNAYAFVAAHLLARKEATTAPVVEPAPTPPPPVTSVVTNPLPTVPPATETPIAAAPPANPPTLLPQPIVTTPAPVAPPVEEPAAPRVVQREGVVSGTVSIQAPTHFQLESLDTHKVIDYMYTTSTNLLLQRYRGMTVLVTGEEGLDERWPNTPVITIERIQVVQP
ncbi:MAG TPA: SH3 domain-containing protein [Verrucomicrobiae bacterium]|nr:SH3 domain-containing protein [Verrucomicrobiae bacterium]